MTRMPDSIYPANLPPGFPAYLGYVDGEWATADDVRKAHPGAHVVALTVLGSTLNADGVDSEKGDLSAVGAALWVHRKLAAAPDSRPVVYASAQGDEGYGMPWCVEELLKLGIQRSQWRCLTAHYGEGEHICGPSTCETKFQADGTQWTDKFPGAGGTTVDMSLLADDFFADWTFAPVRNLSSVRGPHSLRLSWASPGTPAPEAVHHYQVTVRLKGRDIRGFPVTLPFGHTVSEQWNGVEAGSYDEAMVRACAVDGHCSPWAVVRW